MRMCRHLLAGGLAVALVAGAAAARASTASEYISIRARHQPTRIADLKVLEENLEHFAGRHVELAGEIAGRMRCGQRDLVLLKVGDSGTAQIAVTHNAPQMAMGGKVRVIAQAPESRLDPSCRLVAIAWEREIAALEPSPVAVTVSPARQPPPATGGPSPRAPVPAVAPAGVVAEYAKTIQRFNRRLSANQATEIARAIIDFSARQGLDARLVMAVVAAESNFNPYARSRKGAMGLGQLMPTTARGMGVRDPWDYRQNLEAAVRLIRGHLAKNSGDLALALACYNAGSGAVRRHGGVPPYAETHNYIRKVVSLLLAFAPEYAEPPK